MTKKLKDTGAELIATDVSQKMLDSITFVPTKKADIQNLPFEKKSFDIVIAAFVIVHLKNLEQAFSEVHRVLKDGGYFIFSNINQRKAPLLEVGKEKFFIESFYHRPKNVIRELEDCYFDVLEEKFIFEGEVWVNQIIKAKKVQV